MKRYFIIVILVLVLGTTLLAEPLKVAIGAIEKKDRDSDYIVSALKKRDFKNLFKANDQYELMDIKKAEKAISSATDKDFKYLGKDEKIQVAKDIGVDVIMWGEVTSQNKNQFKIILSMIGVATEDFKDVKFTVTKNSKDRLKAMEENIFCTLDDACQADTDILIDIAMQQFSMRQYEQAEQSFLAALGADPENVQAMYYLGAIKYVNKDLDSALEYFENGLEISPENDDLLNQISRVYEKMERFDEAIDALQQMSDAEENPETWMRIAAMYQNEEYYTEAQEAYENVIMLNDTIDNAYLELSDLLYEQELYDEALPYLEEAVKRFPEDDMLNKKLAKAYQKTGKIESAIKQYQDLIAADESNLRAHYNLANAYITINDYDKALSTALKIKEKNPEDPQVYILLANSYSTLKNFSDAESSAKKALELDAENYQAYRILSEIYQGKGYVEYEKFLEYEETAKSLYGTEADEMIEKRDGARDKANALFQQSSNYLDEAKGRTTLNSELRYIQQRKETIKQLLEATKKSFF